MKSFYGLLNIKPCPLFINNSKLHLTLHGITYHTQLKIPPNRSSLVKCSLFNCHKMIIRWFWQARLVLEIMSQTQMEVSFWSQDFAQVPIGPACDLLCRLSLSIWKMRSWTSGLEVQAISGHLRAGIFWSPQSLKEQMLSVRSSAQSLIVPIYSAASGRAESWTFHSSAFRRQDNEPWG